MSCGGRQSAESAAERRPCHRPRQRDRPAGPTCASAAGGSARLARTCRRQHGETVLDVAGCYVTPGIIDMHAHVFSTHRRSTLSLDPHVNTFSSGVTTVVDAGTAGWRDFADFRAEVIDRARIRVLAYVNIVGSGMGGEWEHDVREMRPELAAAMAEEHRDVVVGIKTAHYWAKRPFDAEHPPWAAVDAAVEAGELCGLPVMVDFFPWLPERPYPDLILEKLRPGDIHTHVFAQQFPVIDERGRVFDHLFQARERGVIFDLGHGAASFWFRNAVPAIRAGLRAGLDQHRPPHRQSERPGDRHGDDDEQDPGHGRPARRGHRALDRRSGAGDRATRSWARSPPAPRPTSRCWRWTKASSASSTADRPGSRASQRLRCVLTLRAGEIVYNPLGLGLPSWREVDQLTA